MPPLTEPRALRLLRLRSAAAAVCVPLEEQQTLQLINYLGLLERWNAVHNLSALHETDDLLVRHVFDSLPLASVLMRYASERDLQRLRVLDAGSGSGFPAVVLAVAQPRWAVTAVDSVAKKVAFVRQAASECGIANLRAVRSRVEELSPAHAFDVIVSKALGTLDDLVMMSLPALAEGGVWVAQKGKIPRAEIERLGAGFQVFHVEPVKVPELAEERCLVWIRRTAAH
jgi:16S rRNA (guanine527-N7)-methyltransferase